MPKNADRKFIEALEGCKDPNPAFAAHDEVPAIYPIELKKLDTGDAGTSTRLKKLLIAIATSGSFVDWGRKTSNSDDSFGAMRQIHSNERSHLPRLEQSKLDNLSGRAKTIDHYALTYKKHTADRGGAATAKTTGYVEYTGGDTEGAFQGLTRRPRIVFDYATPRLFLSPFHYHSWAYEGTDTVRLIMPGEVKGADPNPFYWITEITALITEP